MNIFSNSTRSNKKKSPRISGGWFSLTYSQKFTFLYLIFLLPIFAFVPIAYEQFLRIDRYGISEAEGTRYLRNIWQLSNSLQSYHTTNVRLQNGNATIEELNQTREQVETSLQNLIAADKIAQNLGLVNSYQGLRAKWDVTQSQSNTTLLFIEDLSDITREVGDKSYLILDPDLDTYYLMDVILLKLPENQNLLFESNLLLENASIKNELSAQDANQLQLYLNTLELNLVEINRGLSIADQNNDNESVTPALQSAYEEYRTSLELYISTVRQSTSSVQLRQEDFQVAQDLYEKSVDKSTDFYNVASSRLEAGIQNRVISEGRQLLFLFSLSLASIAIAIFLGSRIIHEINTPLQKTIQAAEQFTSGNTAFRIDYQARDEAGKVIFAFNQMAEEIETVQSALQQRSFDLENKTRKLETIAKVAHEITSIRELGEILERSTNLIYENFGYYHVGIFLLDERKEYAILTAANSEGGLRMLENGHSLKVGETGIVGFVAQNLQARIALDVGTDAIYFNNPDLPETRSEMALPLVVGGQILGVLDVQSTEARAFNQEDVSIIQILADQLAVAISNANLYSDATKAVETARATYGQISREAWSKILRSQSAIGFLATPPTTVQLQNTGLNPVIAKAIETGDLILGEDGTTISVPIKIRGQVIGAIRLKKSGIAGAWTQDETNLAIALSDQLSGALESARLYRESLQRAARESLVSEITSRITASTTRDTIIRETVQELGQSIGNVSVTFQLLEPLTGEKHADVSSRTEKGYKSE